MPQTIAPRVLSWASDIEPDTVEQAARAAAMPFVVGGNRGAATGKQDHGVDRLR